MNIQRIKLSELHPDPENTRIHDEANIGIIMNSLSNFGQYRPFVVQKEGMIIRVGNGMYQAMMRLGWTEANCEVRDISDEEAITLSILDNKSSDLSKFDDKGLVAALGSLSKENLDLTGFNTVQISKSTFTANEKGQSKFDKVGDLPLYSFLFKTKKEMKEIESFIGWLDSVYPDDPDLPPEFQPMIAGDKFMAFLKDNGLFKED